MYVNKCRAWRRRCLTCPRALGPPSRIPRLFAPRDDAPAAAAATPGHPPVVVQDSERRELTSAIVDEVFELHVYFPRGYHESGAPLPVVYLLDAEYSFGAVAYIVRRLVKDGLIPPVLLVGIAYEVPYDDYYRRRARGLDYRVRIFPDETHRTVFPIAVTHGLRFVFAGETAASSGADDPAHAAAEQPGGEVS